MNRCCCYGYEPECDWCNNGATTQPERYYLVGNSVSNAASIDSILWTQILIANARCGDVATDPPTSIDLTAEAACWCHQVWSPFHTLLPVSNVGSWSYDPDSVCQYYSSTYYNCGFPSTLGGVAQASIRAEAFLQLDTDPTYLLLILRTTFPIPRNDYLEQIGAAVITVVYRYPRSDRQCDCPMCFEKFSEDITGDYIDNWCDNFPDFITLNPGSGGSGTVDCRGEEYGYGVGAGCYGTNTGGGETSCGETTFCLYLARADASSSTGFSWYLSSYSCGEGCSCRDPSYYQALFPPTLIGDAMTDNCYT